MSHKPPLPDAATPPYSREPAPIQHGHAAGPSIKADDTTQVKISNRTLGIAAGAAIGSAAVAAALLYYNRPATPAKRTAPVKPASKRTVKPKTAVTKTKATVARPRSAAAKSASTKSAPKPRARAKPKPKLS